MSYVLTKVENDRRISREQDPEFLKHLELGLLSVLREENRITEAQYKGASEILLSGRKSTE